MKLRFPTFFVIALLLLVCGFLYASASAQSSTTAQPVAGVVVEDLEEHGEGAKAGIREGDIILAWSHNEVKGKINSQFDLYQVEIEQGPRMGVILEGRRGEENKTWTMGPNPWSVFTKPQLPDSLRSKYEYGWQLAENDQPIQAATAFRGLAVEARSSQPPWLVAWLLDKAAQRLTLARVWNEVDDVYEEAIREVVEVEPAAAAQLSRNWAGTFERRDNSVAAEKLYLQALDLDKKLGAESLVVADDITSIGDVAYLQDDLVKAKEYAESALTISERVAPNSLAVARCLDQVGMIALEGGDLDGAEISMKQALDIKLAHVPDSYTVASTLRSLGDIAAKRDDLEHAYEEYQLAALIAKQIGLHSFDTLSLSTGILTGVANIASKQGRLDQAESFYHAVLDMTDEKYHETLYDRFTSLLNLGNIAVLQRNLDDADDYYRRALDLSRRLVQNRRGSLDTATTFARLAVVARRRDKLSEAEDYDQKALEIRQRIAPDKVEVAESLEGLGQTAWKRNDPAKAAQYNQRALVIRMALVPNSLPVASSLANLGALALERGDLNQAEQFQRAALSIRQELAPWSADYAQTLAALAKIMVRKKETSTAQQFFEQSLDTLENQVARLGGVEDLQADFRSAHADYYLDYIDFLMANHQTRSAFAVAERWRAQSLLKVLTEANLDIREGVDGRLLQQEKALQEQLLVESSHEMRTARAESVEESQGKPKKPIEALLVDYREIERQIRARSQRYADLKQPQPLNAREIQEKVLDSDTMLLEYALGDDRSFLWAVTRNSLTSYELPKREKIEALAASVHRLLSVPPSQVATGARSFHPERILSGPRLQNSLKELSRVVLGPVRFGLRYKRLLIVADGTLQYIPFGVLFEPGVNQEQPLLVRHVVVSVPSASTLALLRRDSEGRQNAEKAVAVFADPVFNTRDERVSQVGTVAEQIEGPPQTPASEGRLLDRARRDAGTGDWLPRLPYTRNEAERILKLAPATSFEAQGFRASKATVQHAELDQYSILHFATHGLLDSEHPDLSGLVLSLLDERGQPVEGFLRSLDIFNLKLRAHLVVLSACQTGLGKEVRGEGLIGLTRAFMYAGAPRVVVSLWSVNDPATAELMARFYQGMLRGQKLSPAEALRAAQISMWQTKRWKSPYYWAAFVLQGDWR